MNRLLFAIVAVCLGVPAFAQEVKPIDHEINRYLFLDDHWIAGQWGVSRHFHAATKEEGNPFFIKHEGENNIGPYWFWPAKRQAPYSAWFGSYDGLNYPVSFTTSEDGFQWDGKRHFTNALTVGNGNIQAAIPVYDESGQYGEYRYLCAQCVRHTPEIQELHWRPLRSRDGIQWELFPDAPVWFSPSDYMMVFWDPGKKKFVSYYKVWRYQGTTLDGKPITLYGHMDLQVDGETIRIVGNTTHPRGFVDVTLQYGGDASDDGGGGTTDEKMQMRRVLGYSESSDFIHWENQQIIVAAPNDASLGDQTYGTYVNRYGNMYIMWCNSFNSITGLIQPFLAWSHDGIQFSVHEKQYFLTSGKQGEWDFGMVFPAELMDAGNGKMFMLYGSLGLDHKDTNEENYRAGFGRAWLRKDGFASLKGGWITTVPLTVRAKQMSLNMTGKISLTLKNTLGEVIAEAQLQGDHHNRVPEIDLSDYLNRDIIVHLDLSQGELYSISL